MAPDTAGRPPAGGKTVPADTGAPANRTPAPIPAQAGSAPSDSLRADSAASAIDTIEYSAVRIRYGADRFSLSQKALLSYKGSQLSADSIVFYPEDKVVDAIGRPLIRDPQNPPIAGYQMRYNLDTKVGEIYYGSSKRDKQTFNGMEVRRMPDGEIHIARGDFSTCDLPDDKHYYFYGRRMILEPKAKVISGPIVLNVADVPVGVLPMMLMPLGTGRRSGLLQPKFGGDQAQGFYMTGLGYYWALSDYTDFLLSGDLIEGERGTFDNTNVNATYRYNLRYRLSGSLAGKYYIREFNPANSGWQLEVAHDQLLTPDGRQTFKGNGLFVSNRNVIDTNALTEEEALKQTANANFGYRRQFEWNQSTLNLDYNQTYNLQRGDLDRDLPDFRYSVTAPLFPQKESEYWDDPSENGAGGSGGAAGEEDGPPWWERIQWHYDNRINFNQVDRPAAGTFPGSENRYLGYLDRWTTSAKYPFLDYINLTPELNFSQAWSLTQRQEGDSLSTRLSRPQEGEAGEYFPFFNTRLIADTRLYGIGNPKLGRFEAVRHTVIPSVGLTWAPQIDSNPDFVPHPKLHGTAFQEEQQTINFSLGNDIDIKILSEEPRRAGAGSGSGSGSGAAAGSQAGAAGGGAAGAGSQAGAGGTALPGAGALPSDSAGKLGQGPDARSRQAVNYKILSASSSTNYNRARTVRPWSDITSTFSTEIVKNVAFTFNTLHSFYDNFAQGAARDREGIPIWMGYSWGWRRGLDVSGSLNNGLRLENTDGSPFTRFDASPWSASANFSFSESGRRVARATWDRSRTYAAGGGLKLNPTRGWNMSYSTDYDFTRGEFSRHAFTFNRTLHCWQMDFNWTPTGVSEGWSFVIRIIDLPDVKLETSDARVRRRR